MHTSVGNRVCLLAALLSMLWTVESATAQVNPIKIPSKGPDIKESHVIGKSADGRFVTHWAAVRTGENQSVESSEADEFLLYHNGGEAFTCEDGTVLQATAGDAVFVPRGWKGRRGSHVEGYEAVRVLFSSPASPVSDKPEDQTAHPRKFSSNDPKALATPDVKTQGIYTYRVLGMSVDGEFRAGRSSMQQPRTLDTEASVDEFLFVLKGKQTYTSVGGTVVEVNAGDGVFVPKGWKGRYETDGYEELYVIYGMGCMTKKTC